MLVTYSRSQHHTLSHTTSCTHHYSLTAQLTNPGTTPHITTILRPFFQDHPGEPVPEENFWTLWCKGRLTEADTPTIWLGTTPSGLTSAHLHHPPRNMAVKPNVIIQHFTVRLTSGAYDISAFHSTTQMGFWQKSKHLLISPETDRTPSPSAFHASERRRPLHSTITHSTTTRHSCVMHAVNHKEKTITTSKQKKQN